jgi:hypothetical protein
MINYPKFLGFSKYIFRHISGDRYISDEYGFEITFFSDSSYYSEVRWKNRRCHNFHMVHILHNVSEYDWEKSRIGLSNPCYEISLGPSCEGTKFTHMGDKNVDEFMYLLIR